MVKNFSASLLSITITLMLLPRLALAEDVVPVDLVCRVAVKSVHQHPGLTYASSNVGRELFVKIDRTANRDKIWCDKAGPLKGFERSYCESPYQVRIEHDLYLFGDNAAEFRGRFPYDYIILFNDKTFILSMGNGNGVVVESGLCEVADKTGP